LPSCVRILVIEDDPANLELMRGLLSAHGHSVIAARDGASGVDMAREERPDLVLCDMQLPVIGGIEVVTLLRGDSVTHALPVVAVTALTMPGDRESILAAGFDGYLAKPISPETFVQQVEAFLPPRVTRD
jgi:two-component system, cell cycle response regulator